MRNLLRVTTGVLLLGFAATAGIWLYAGSYGFHVPARHGNRSLVARDVSGRIIIGTTTDAFFSLDRLAKFLNAAPLDIDAALNLDGGPIASQGVSINGFNRRTYGKWEIKTKGNEAELMS